MKDKPKKLIDKIVDGAFLSKPFIKITAGISLFLITDGMEMFWYSFYIIPINSKFNLKWFTSQIISSLLFIGVALGSAFASKITRTFNRVKSILFFMVLLLVSHLALTLIINLVFFSVLRVINGFCLGVIMPIYMSIYTEYLPIKYRGFLLIAIWVAFDVGMLFLPVISVKIMPDFESGKMQTCWLITNIFYFISIIFNFFLLKDSPRFLILDGRDDEAFAILEEMNENSLNSEEKKLILSEVKNKTNLNLKSKFSELFNNNYIKSTVIGILIFFIYSCGLYGLSLIMTLTQEKLNELQSIESTENSSEIYKTIFINYGTGIPAIIIAGFLGEIKCIGRVKMIWILMIFAGIFSIASIVWAKSYKIFMAFLSFFTNSYGSIYGAFLYEIYPTKLRDIAGSFLFMTLRISSIVNQYLFYGVFVVNYKAPYFLFSAMNFCGVFFAMFLPNETIDKPLDEDFDDVLQKEEEKSLLKNEENYN